jgi:NAD(P)-dependent dehydrogenase (short-subunit alcohol dehydrogenase family)
MNAMASASPMNSSPPLPGARMSRPGGTKPGATTPRTILITGATDGLGRALAKRLAGEGHRLVLHGRDAERLARAAEEVRDIRDGAVEYTSVADFADLNQVRGLARDVRSAVSELDVLVNNAGIGAGLPEGPARGVSTDGYELRFAVNYLASFLLTLELLPMLRANSPARVVNVASLGQHPMDFDNLMLERGYDGMRAYGQSKLAMITSGFELASRLSAAEVTVNSLHPATFMPTKMVLQELGYSIHSINDGVRAVCHLIDDPKLARTSGAFFDRTTKTRAHAQAYDPTARKELWSRSLALVGANDIDD